MSYPKQVMRPPTRNGRFDWYYTRWGGILAVRLIKVWLKVWRQPRYDLKLDRPTLSSKPLVIVSNHQTLLDPPSIFAALSFRDLYAISPVKFMTWHKYYNDWRFKFVLYSTGCYSSHGEGLTGVDGAVTYARLGYASFIFPEGKRTNPTKRRPAYNGIAKILEQLPDARLVLAHIDWEKRRKRFSRPKVRVVFAEAPADLDRGNPDAIMDAIYRL